MPTTDQILSQVRTIANTWQLLSVLWHLAFALFSIALISGARPSRRTCGMFLSLPVLSVGIVAWLSGNPFNGTLFTLIGILLLATAARLPRDPVRIVPSWWKVPGIVMIVFGWAYPHFLNEGTPLSYLYAAPAGLIPCPTLSIVIGFALVLRYLESRSYSRILAVAGLFYGITGVLQLQVAIDWVLLFGAIVLLTFSFLKADRVWRYERDRQQREMTEFGVGPRLAVLIVCYLALAVIAQINSPDMMLMTSEPLIVFPAVGAVLVATGLVFWAIGATKIDKAFKEHRLLTSGVYGVVRHPMYCGLILFVGTGIAIWCRSWALLTVPLAACVGFTFLHRVEDRYLEKTFGQEYLQYRSKVNALVPFLPPLFPTPHA